MMSCKKLLFSFLAATLAGVSLTFAQTSSYAMVKKDFEKDLFKKADR